MPYPRYVMSLHSSKKVLSDQIAPPPYMLADAIIRLTMERGQRHEGKHTHATEGSKNGIHNQFSSMKTFVFWEIYLLVFKAKI